MVRQRRWVVVLWGVLLLVAVPGSVVSHQVLHGGGGQIAGSQSEQVDRVLQREFAGAAYLYPVLVVCHSDSGTVRDAPFEKAVDELQARLPAVAPVQASRSYRNTQSWDLTSPDGHTTVVLLSMQADSAEQVEGQVPLLRQALASLRAQLPPGFEALVTGDAAFNYDIDELSARDSVRAELRTLPVVAVCLWWAFGAALAAGLPLIVGVLSTTVTGAVVYLLGHVMPLSILIENTARMIGLGTGIDYALISVSRFREALARGADIEQAVAETVATSGRAVAASGLMVVVGMASLLVNPLPDIRSMALGCILVVVVAVLVTLTLLPACLSWLGRRLATTATVSDRWTRWATAVVQRPGLALVVGLLALAALIEPACYLRTATMDGSWMPAKAESRQGYDRLLSMGRSGVLTPIRLLIEAPGSMLTSPHLAELQTAVQRWQHDPRIASVQSLVSVDPTMGLDEYEANYQDPDMLKDGMFHDVVAALLGHGGTATLVYVTPANGLSNKQLLSLVADLRSHPTVGTDLTVAVGGYGGWLYDLEQGVRHSAPLVVACIVVLTWLTLFRVFQSWLLPLKAIVLNLLSVGAAFGVLVMVFQWNWLGLSDTPGRVLIVIPLMLFGIVFSLSMDYEVFLVSRIQEYWLETGDNQQATRLGLAATGPLITSAALVMVLVFGCFSLADMVIVQMLGVGLTMAVAVDATLIRVAVAPAFMQLAGRWNWEPGGRSTPGPNPTG